MIIRAVKGKFGPITEYYQGGSYQKLDQDDDTKRGVLAGLDNSHNKDFKVKYVSDPALFILGKAEKTDHDEIKQQLHHMGLWNESFHECEIAHTQTGGPEYSAAFMSVRESNAIDRYIETIDNHSEGLSLSTDTTIEANVPDLQRNLTNFTSIEGASEATANK